VRRIEKGDGSMNWSIACNVDDHFVARLLGEYSMSPEMGRSVANDQKVLKYFLELGFLNPIFVTLMFDQNNILVLNCALELHNFK